MCDETLSKLLQWISEIEDKLANQDTVREDIEELKNQINVMKVSYFPKINNDPLNKIRIFFDALFVVITLFFVFFLRLQEIKEDLESHGRQVSSCLDQVRQVVLTGSDVLSSDEVSTLEKSGRSLKTRFDKTTDRADKLVRRLVGARDELCKFKLVQN